FGICSSGAKCVIVFEGLILNHKGHRIHLLFQLSRSNIRLLRANIKRNSKIDFLWRALHSKLIPGAAPRATNMTPLWGWHRLPITHRLLLTALLPTVHCLLPTIPQSPPTWPSHQQLAYHRKLRDPNSPPRGFDSAQPPGFTSPFLPAARGVHKRIPEVHTGLRRWRWR